MNKKKHQGKKLKIAFINTYTDPTESALFGSFSSRLVPMGILLLASIIRKQGHVISIVDYNHEKEQNTLNDIFKKKPDIVLFSSTTPLIEYAVNLAKKIKAYDNSIIIIIGGPHISVCPKETLEKYPSFDLGLTGQSEQSLIKLLELMKKKKILTELPGLVYRQKNHIVYNPPRTYSKSLDDLPFPAWDLLKGFPDKYQPTITSIKQSPAASLITSRGCPYNCKFCDKSIFGSHYHAESVSQTVEKIKYLNKRFGIQDIFFLDDDFLIDKERVKQICQRILELKIKISWSCITRASNIESDLLKLMKIAGCWQLSFGVESGSQTILNLISKGISVESAKKSIQETKKAGMSARIFIMIGCPGETISTLKETMKFLKLTDPDDIVLGYFTPICGSELSQDYEKYGKFDYSWKNMDFYKPNFIPHCLDVSNLIEYYRKILISFYLKPRILGHYLFKKKLIFNPSFIMEGFKTIMKLLVPGT